MIGATLSHYRILGQIGAGGIGVVYRARDQRLEREVAIKVLSAGALADEAQRRRFYREALALSRLNHPGIATVHAFEHADGADFIVMELVPGETLAARLRSGALPAGEVADLGAQIAEALEGAHEQGVLHRDLKPGNIMVTARGRVKLLDFGLARLAQAGADSRAATVPTAGDAVAGTLAYMSPEQLLGGELDARSDLFSLGVILYEMATGTLPWRQTLVTALVNEIVHTTPPPAGALRADLPPGLEAIIVRALEKQPAARHPSASALLADLRGGLATAAGPQGSRAEGTSTPARSAATSPPRAGPAEVLGYRPPRAAGAPRIESLAVLPLHNLSGDPEQEFFADGLTESLIGSLGRIGTLRVISCTSAMVYKGVRRPLPEIARELGVDAVVEGAVLRSSERVRVTARLVDAGSDRHLWSRSFDRPLGDILDLQSEISREIAEELRARWTPGERRGPAGGRPVDPIAYEAYLRGRFFWNKRTPEGLSRAIEAFQRSIDADPLYAPAWSGLADGYNLLGAFRWRRSREAFPRARAAAARALELDPDLAEGHTSLASTLYFYDWDWTGAEESYRRAIALDPGYATAHQWYSEFLVALGRFDEALAEIRQAVDHDPLSVIAATSYGDAHYYARRYEEAVARYRRTLDLEPGFYWARLNLARATQALGRHEEAISLYEDTLREAGTSLGDSPVLAYAWAAAGRRKEAESILRAVVARWREGSVSPYSIANVYAALGDIDQAFAWLDRAVEDRDRMLVYLRVHPRLDPLREDRRFRALLGVVGLGA